MKNSIYPFLFFAFLIISCGKSNQNIAPNDNVTDYIETLIPEPIEELYDAFGDPSKDTVWVFLQNGPKTKKDFPFETEDKNSQKFDFFLDDYRVYPNEVQHLNKGFKTFTNFTFENARKEAEHTVSILNNIVKYFKAQNKTVYLIGHAYGGFLIQRYLASFDSIADGNALLNTRLNMDEIVWKNYSLGKTSYFDSIGKNPQVLNERIAKLKRDKSVISETERLNLFTLTSALISWPYLVILEEVNFTKTLFFHAQNDTVFGALTTEELDFLNKKTVPHISVTGNQEATIDFEVLKKVADYLTGKSSLTTTTSE